MTAGGPLLIVKRDGSREPFEFVKLRRCLSRAIQERRQDARLADALANAVAIHLEQWYEPKPPSSDYLFRCAYTVLRETGLGDVAEVLARHRRERRAQRARLRVADGRLGERRGTLAWRKAAIVSTLRERYSLGRPVARMLAGEIESRALSLNYERISTVLVAELIRSEMTAWGLLDDDAAGEGVPATDGPIRQRRPGQEN